MTPKARFASLLLGASLGLSSLVGCSPDALSTGTGDDDDRNEQLGILCTGELAITGTFVASAPQPADVFGCWPVGTWTFHATIANTDCDDTSALLPEYSFEVTRDADENESYAYLTDPAYERVRLGVTSGGGGLCEGSVEVYSLDGKTIVNMKPALQADGSINGNGEYEVYGADQWE